MKRCLPRRALAASLALTSVLTLHAAAAAEPPPVADQDSDLDRIPPAALEQPAAATTDRTDLGSRRKLYLENAATQAWTHDVPVAAPGQSAWQERLLLDLRTRQRWGADWTWAFSDRLNLRAEDGLNFPSRHNVTNDLRELWLGWQPAPTLFIDAGRINLKSGVALGFNPTDYFKTRAVVEPLSIDPAVLREDRLGTLMLQAQRIGPAGAVTVALAPAVAPRTPIYSDTTLPSFDPMFGRTNATDRFLLKLNRQLGDGLAPELLAYHEPGITRWGANVTAPLGQRVILYGEWSAGPDAGLVGDALSFERSIGAPAAQAIARLPRPAALRFMNAAATGFSYAAPESRMTLNLEYDYYQGGFTRSDWTAWFSAGSGLPATAGLAQALWTVRSYALDQQQPIQRGAVFARLDWMDALIPKLELSALASIDASDGSARWQLTADYYLSDRWTVGALVLLNGGARRSDFGSQPQAGSVLLKVVRYL